jgi:CheY-like chemotaxis protein
LPIEQFLAGRIQPPIASTAAAENGSGAGGAAEHKTILFVEDDETTVYAVSRILEAAGYEVLLAPDYREALAALESSRPIDLMLTDVRLATGTPHGFALGRMARVRRPEIRIVYVTGVAEIPESEIATALGPILTKPIEPAVLLEEISRALAAC